jgi:hypothetical protein
MITLKCIVLEQVVRISIDLGSNHVMRCDESEGSTTKESINQSVRMK